MTVGGDAARQDGLGLLDTDAAIRAQLAQANKLIVLQVAKITEINHAHILTDNQLAQMTVDKDKALSTLNKFGDDLYKAHEACREMRFELSNVKQQLAAVTVERDMAQVLKVLDPGNPVLTLQQQLAERDATIARLEQVLKGDALVESIHYETGQPLDLRLSHPLVASIAASLADLLAQHQAENYLEISMHSKTVGPLTLTLQRASNPTPHQLRMKAEARVTELEAVLATILDAVDYTSGACSLTEMVGACLPTILIANAKAALKGKEGV
jgi:hypothetical protein